MNQRTGKRGTPPNKPYYKTLGTTTVDNSYTVEQGEFAPLLFVCFFIVAVFSSALFSYRFGGMTESYNRELAELQEIKTGVEESSDTHNDDILDTSNEVDVSEQNSDDYGTRKRNHQITMDSPDKLADMAELYSMNEDTVGWLRIPDTNVDYPLMQTMEDENFYLDRDFQKNYSANGCLILDNDSDIGTGTFANEYMDGTLPSTNLIIHGHNMKNGAMFGNLDKYRQKEYESTHNIIKLSSLYEEREYEIMAVCLSQVFLKSQTDVFKYYKFFEAYTEDEFNDFVNGIKEIELYDTGVNAEYGDEFITLSVCAYHVENGRLIVVGKRIK